MIPIAQPVLDEKERENILEVMDSGMLAQGEYVTRFERDFASFLGVERGVAVINGTAALHTALRALGIGEGDKVITTPFTFIASSNALLYCGARPVFVDIKPDSYNIDPEKIEQKLREDPDIKALLVVHLYGQPCDMEPIMKLVEEYELLLIEDCAQAHGAVYRDEYVGFFGDAAVFSFYPTKNMTTGEGGMVVSGNREVIDRARYLINHGSSKKYFHEMLGYNYRMTNLMAAIGLAQLDKLPEFNRQRCQNAAFLREQLQELDWLGLPVRYADRRSVFHLFTVSCEERDRLADYLAEKGVGCGIYYPVPVFEQPLYKKRGLGNLSLPVVEKAAAEVISLPVHPALTEKDLQHIIKVIKEFK